MDDGSGYFDCSSEIESVSDATKIANIVMTGTGEGERQCRVKYETEILADRLGIMGLVKG